MKQCVLLEVGVAMIGRVLRVYLLVAIGATAPAYGQADSDSRPPVPDNLRSQTYSTTAIELFWDRVADSTLSYEISIDGELVQINQGTSYFTDELVAGQGYVFTVAAIDSGGLRSADSTITASTLPDPNQPSIIGPEAPANTRLLVYSRTAAELFWDRAPAAQDVVTTEISRNGSVIGMAEGNSFFDNTREPGLQYEYGLTAIDASNNRSQTSILIETSDIPLINRDNYIDIVSEVLTTFHGGSYDQVVTAKDRILDNLLAELFSDILPSPAIRSCSNGGTANFLGIIALEFSDCQSGNFVFNGPFFFNAGNVSTFGASVGETLAILISPNTTLDFIGSIEISGLQEYGYSASLSNLMLSTPIETLALENLDTEFGIGVSSTQQSTFTGSMSGAFDISSSATGDELVRVSTSETFGYSESVRTHSEQWNFRSGVLQLRARDNSQVSLNASTGDDTTVAISLNDDVNGLEQFVLPWSTWDDALRRIP